MALTVVVDALSDDGFHVVKEDMDGRLGHQVINDFPIAAGLGLELRLAARIGQGATVEDETAAVAAEVVGIAFSERKTVYGDGQLACRWLNNGLVALLYLVELLDDMLQLGIIVQWLGLCQGLDFFQRLWDTFDEM